MPHRTLDEEALFQVARKFASPEERASYLTQACGDDRMLYERVVELLGLPGEVEQFLESPPSICVVAGKVARDSLPLEIPGTQVGRYRLLEQLGEGGMGVVYVAEQTEPVRRRVALKIIKPGMDTRQVTARFEAERQALALMDHPHIAKVLDGGETDAGRPYFVMELVRGLPITEYCDEAMLSPPKRLELFVAVCQAVQHAHQKGIIHRDLKPSNVLVTVLDGRPIVKVIDFGIAKAIGKRLSERSVYTSFSDLIGTPLYMSPEQAELSSLDVDTRSDIYSLGVLLYELLTGQTPFDRQQMAQAGLDEIRRVIREDEPLRPSYRLSTLNAEAITTAAGRRAVDVRQLGRTLQGELDWIVMKALEKDRNRRYDTAAAFAEDVTRYLTDQPVQAGPPSASYRLKKFVQRNRVAVLTTGSLAMLLLLGLIGTTTGLYRAVRAERIAETERNHADQARRQADEVKEIAEQEAEISRAISNFLREDLLAQAAPALNPHDEQITVEKLLDRAAMQINGRFAGQPQVEAAIRKTMGDTYLRVGGFAAAQKELERALGIYREVLGEDHSDTLDTMSNLAELYRLQGKTAEAEPLASKTLEIGRRVFGVSHRDTLASINNLASIYASQGKYEQAEPLFEESYEHLRKSVGAQQPDTLAVMNNLALIYSWRGKHAKAEGMLVEALEICQRVLGLEDPDTLSSKNNLAAFYKDRRRFEEAEPLFAQVLEARRRVHGPEAPATLTSLNNLASLYFDQEQYERAEPLFVTTLELVRRVEGKAHRHTLTTTGSLASLYIAQGQFQQAEVLLRTSIGDCREVEGQNSRLAAPLLSELGDALVRQEKYVEAEQTIREYLNLTETAPKDWTHWHAQAMLGAALLGETKYAEAEPLLLAGYERLRVEEKEPSAVHRRARIDTAKHLVALYTAMNRPDEVSKWNTEFEAASHRGPTSH